MSKAAFVVQIPKIALRIGDVGVALGVGTQEVRYLLEAGLLPPPRLMLRERFWVRSDLEEALGRIGGRSRSRPKRQSKEWVSK